MEGKLHLKVRYYISENKYTYMLNVQTFNLVRIGTYDTFQTIFNLKIFKS